jgi:hypothetical protein
LDRKDVDPHWYINFRASKHVIGCNEIIYKVQKSHAPLEMHIVNGHLYIVAKKCITNVHIIDGEMKNIDNVLYVLSLCKNLLSIGLITKQGFLVVCDINDYMFINKIDCNIVAIGTKNPRNGFYYLDPHKLC